MKAYEIVTELLKKLRTEAKEGSNLLALDRMAEDFIVQRGGIPANKNYQPEGIKIPYPATLCIGVNDIICHGIPTDYSLKNGDLVSFDVGVKKDGLCGDAAFTMGIGEISNQDERLIKVAKASLYAGIELIKAKAPISNIRFIMENVALRFGFVTNKIMVGHGIGKEMHEAPLIPAFDDPKDDRVLEEGQMICLEPMITRKDRYGYIGDDGWTLRTRDGRKSAIMEMQVLVKKDGYEILTPHLEN